MARQPRIDIANEIYHVINRANAKQFIFNSDDDFLPVISALEETLKLYPIEIFSFCLMSNHWHFVVRPHSDGDLGRFFGKLTQKVTQRWHAYHHTVGSGHLFQGRFKSFLVQTDSYFIQLMKYVEANPLRANLVNRAEDWKWGSLWLRQNSPETVKCLLATWPLEYSGNYLKDINEPLPKLFLEQVRGSINRGRPLGDEAWVRGMVEKYNLKYTIRREGRPCKE